MPLPGGIWKRGLVRLTTASTAAVGLEATIDTHLPLPSLSILDSPHDCSGLSGLPGGVTRPSSLRGLRPWQT